MEGAVYALMVGCGETYFLANAVRLGASPLQQGLVVTLPLCVGAGGAVLSIAMLAMPALANFSLIASRSSRSSWSQRA